MTNAKKMKSAQGGKGGSSGGTGAKRWFLKRREASKRSLQSLRSCHYLRGDQRGELSGSLEKKGGKDNVKQKSHV